MKSFIFLILIFNIFFSNETLGLVTKSKGKVQYKKYSSDKFTNQYYKGLGLYGDDQIRTGDNGFSIYRYLDDASSIKILKNSDIHIQGRVNSRNIVKNVEVSNGVLNFDIDKQSSEGFTIVTPTSIATVKGTNFWLICNGPEGDKFFGIEGEVEVKNIESGRIIILSEDSVVISNSDGNILSQNINTQDLQEIQELQQESGDYENLDIDTGFDDNPIDEDLDSDTNNLSDSDRENSLDSEKVIRIQLEDSIGNLKEIIIKYK